MGTRTESIETGVNLKRSHAYLLDTQRDLS